MINIFTGWVINLSLIWLFSFHFDMKIKGLWLAKVCMQYTVFICNFILVSCTNWQKVSDKSAKRQEKDKKLLENNKNINIEDLLK